MAKRSAFLVQILDKIGAPLMAAIEGFRDVESDDKGVQDAQTLAALLSKAVEMSVNISQNMDLKGDEEDADSVRLALAALSGPLIAEVYKATRKIPDENDVKRMNKNMEAVLTFSDNFAPSASHISRLKSLDDQAIHADEDQNTIYVLQALLPVLGAIAEFPFGQTETTLVQDTSKRLQGHANSLMRKILADDEEDLPKAKYIELMILKALAQVYAESHKAQTKKLLEQQEKGTGGPDITIDHVWQSFDTKVSMLEALVGSSIPGGAQGSADAVAPAPVQSAPPPTQQAPVTEPGAAPETPPAAPTQAPPVSSPPPPQAPAQAAAAPTESSPMGFFKPAPAAGEPQQPPAPAETPPPAPEPTQTPPPAEVPPAPSETPQALPPEAPPPADAASNPMGFFKPAPKDSNQTNQS
ncbi:MAG: hypothetical protein AAF569_01680 [Pseudomonadota bacterium]